MLARHSLAGMELRHLRYFCQVADLGSMSAAAAVLHMTQPSLSRQIAELEAELRHPLFARTSRGVTLTAAGTGLRRHLEPLFAQLDRIPEVVNTASRSQELLHVGVPQGLPHDWFRGLLDAVKISLPSVTLSLLEATSQSQVQLLENGTIDVAVLHLQPPNVESVQVFSQAIGLALPANSPLSSHAALSFADLDGMRLLAHATGAISVDEKRLGEECTSAGVEIEWVFRRFSEHSSLIAASSEVDGALVTEATASRHLPEWVWIPLKVAAGDDLEVRTWLAWKDQSRATVKQLVATMTHAAGLGESARPAR